MQQLLQEREAEKDRDAIQNEMYLNKQKALTDAEHYRYALDRNSDLHGNLRWERLCGQYNKESGHEGCMQIGLPHY